jgi:hypothetical protein
LPTPWLIITSPAIHSTQLMKVTDYTIYSMSCPLTARFMTRRYAIMRIASLLIRGMSAGATISTIVEVVNMMQSGMYTMVANVVFNTFERSVIDKHHRIGNLLSRILTWHDTPYHTETLPDPAP